MLATRVPGGRVRVVEGGTAGRNPSRTRWLRCAPDTDLVAVHDAVRPFIDLETIHKVFDEAAATGAAIVAVPAIDTVKQVTRGTDHVRVRVDASRAKSWSWRRRRRSSATS